MTKLHWAEPERSPAGGFGRRFARSLLWVLFAAGVGLLAVGRLIVRDASSAIERNPALLLEALRQPVTLGVLAAIVAMLATKAAIDEWAEVRDRRSEATAWGAAAWGATAWGSSRSASASTSASRGLRATAGKAARGLVFVGLAIGIFVFRPLAWGGVTSYAVVVGISMEPTMHTGDLAVVMRQETYAVGDIVSYHPSAAPEGEIMHRIVGGDASGWVTQGDNRRDTDPDRSTAATIVGKVVLHVPYAGFVVNSLRNPYVLGTVVAVLVMAVAWDLATKRGRPPKAAVGADSHPFAGR